MDKVLLDIWRIAKARDGAGSWVATIARVLRSARGMVGPALSFINYLGIGMLEQYDVAVLFECDCNNIGLWDILRDAPHDLWLLVAGDSSFLYQRALHVENVQAAALDMQSADFFVILLCRHIAPEDNVKVDTTTMTLGV